MDLNILSLLARAFRVQNRLSSNSCCKYVLKRKYVLQKAGYKRPDNKICI